MEKKFGENNLAKVKEVFGNLKLNYISIFTIPAIIALGVSPAEAEKMYKLTIVNSPNDFSSGTAFVVSSDIERGCIAVTAAHVADPMLASRGVILATIPKDPFQEEVNSEDDVFSYIVKVLATDQETDVAVVNIKKYINNKYQNFDCDPNPYHLSTNKIDKNDKVSVLGYPVDSLSVKNSEGKVSITPWKLTNKDLSFLSDSVKDPVKKKGVKKYTNLGAEKLVVSTKKAGVVGGMSGGQLLMNTGKSLPILVLDLSEVY